MYHQFKKKETILYGLGSASTANAQIAKAIENYGFVGEFREIKLEFIGKELKYGKGKGFLDYDEVKKLLRQIIEEESPMEMQEKFVALFFDTQMSLIGYLLHSKGAISTTAIETKILVSVALAALATNVIICHNHPSINAEPSDADIKATSKLKRALDSVDINLIDHIILTPYEKASSFRHKGLLKDTIHHHIPYLQEITSTMITKENYRDKPKHIDFSKLPKALKDGHEMMLEELENDFYDQVPEVRETVDLYLEKLNAYLQEKEGTKSKTKVEKSTPAKTKKPQTQSKPQAQPKPQTEAPSKRRHKPKPIDKTEKEEIKGNVWVQTREVYHIKRYLALEGKVANIETIDRVLSALQKDILEGKIRKTSVHKDEIENIQNNLVKIYNDNKTVEIALSAEAKERLQAIVANEKVEWSVFYAKKIINLIGKESKEKAQKLLAAIEKKRKNNPHFAKEKKYDTFLSALRALEKYAAGNSAKLQFSETQLNGLHGLAGANGLSGISDDEIINSYTLKNIAVDVLGLRPPYSNVMGKVASVFTALIYGKPGQGKSTFCLGLGQELAKFGKVLLVSGEEGRESTMIEKFKRLNAYHANFDIATKLVEDKFSHYQFVFIDSFSHFGKNVEDLIRYKRKYPKTSFILISHATKEGNYKGMSELAHEVQIMVKVENGIASSYDKNRYGKGEMKVIFE